MHEFERPALAFRMNEPGGYLRNRQGVAISRRKRQSFETGSLTRFREIE